MKVTVIKFEQLFATGQYENQRLSVEVEVPDFHPSTGESNWDKAMDAFKEAKELVNSAFQSLNPSQPSISQTVPEVQVDRTQVEKRQLLLDIDSATCLRLPDGTGGLLQWQHVVRGDKELEGAFWEKYNAISFKDHQADVLENTKLK